MKWQLSPDFHKILKKVDVRIRDSFWEALEVFEKNPNDPTLDHKELKRTLKGLWKIDITEDVAYAALYELIKENKEEIAFFVQIGKKEDLYKE